MLNALELSDFLWHLFSKWTRMMVFPCRSGGMVDAVDSKSTLGNKVPVQVRPSASLFMDLIKWNQKIFKHL